MTEEQADELIDRILAAFAYIDIDINKKLTIFARVQNLIYENVDK